MGGLAVHGSAGTPNQWLRRTGRLQPCGCRPWHSGTRRRQPPRGRL